MQILCRGYLDEDAASLARLAQIMDSIRTFEIERPQLVIADVMKGEEKYYVDCLFVEDSGDFVGWFVRRKRFRRGEHEVFCEKGSENAVIEVLRCGVPELINKLAILTTERVLSFFSRLIDGGNVSDYEIKHLDDVIEGFGEF